MEIATNAPTASPWGICICGADAAELTAEKLTCRQFARDILRFTTEPERLWSNPDDMLQATEDGQIKDLVTPAPHRISRDLRRYMEIEGRLVAAGVRIHIADGCPDGSTEGNLTMRSVSYGECPEFQDTGDRPRKVSNTDRTISEDDYRRVQERRERIRKDGNPTSGLLRCGACERGENALLPGILRCDWCGNPMITTLTKGRRSYRCVEAIRRPDTPRTCCSRPINGMDLDQEIWSSVEAMVSNPAQAIKGFRDAGVEVGPEDERRLINRCQRIAPSLDGLDQRGRRDALHTLGIQVKALDRGDGIWIRTSPQIISDGTPAED